MAKDIYSQAFQQIILELKKARIKAGFNQGDVAEKLRKSQSYISKIESGQIRLDVVQLKKLALIYGKTVADFIQ